MSPTRAAGSRRKRFLRTIFFPFRVGVAAETENRQNVLEFPGMRNVSTIPFLDQIGIIFLRSGGKKFFDGHRFPAIKTETGFPAVPADMPEERRAIQWHRIGGMTMRAEPRFFQPGVQPFLTEDPCHIPELAQMDQRQLCGIFRIDGKDGNFSAIRTPIKQFLQIMRPFQHRHQRMYRDTNTEDI